jgi:hypothetical protein
MAIETQTGTQVIEVLKWIGIVFAAGFIGYFGRYLSMMIIDRIQKKKDLKRTPPPEEKQTTTIVESDDADKDRLKLEKKKLKLEKKRTKKEEE